MDLRDLLRQAVAAADRDAERRRTPVTSFRFGGVAVNLRIEEPLTPLLKMVTAPSCQFAPDGAHLDVVAARLPELDILLPPPEQRRYTVLRGNSDIYYLWLDEGGGCLTALDRQSRRGLTWYPEPDRVASWHVARPFLHAIKGFARGTAWTPVHAAAVAKNGRAILLVGQSGVGKTSIAVGCALSGWDYLGDDAVMVCGDPPRVAALYSSARLRSDTFELFPRAMTASLGVSDDAGEPKAEIDMSALDCCRCLEASVEAVVFPVAGSGTETVVRPLNRSEAVRKLMDASRQSLKGDERITFDKLSALVSKVPCVTLQRNGDAGSLQQALSALLGTGDAA